MVNGDIFSPSPLISRVGRIWTLSYILTLPSCTFLSQTFVLPLIFFVVPFLMREEQSIPSPLCFNTKLSIFFFARYAPCLPDRPCFFFLTLIWLSPFFFLVLRRWRAFFSILTRFAQMFSGFFLFFENPQPRVPKFFPFLISHL